VTQTLTPSTTPGANTAPPPLERLTPPSPPEAFPPDFGFATPPNRKRWTRADCDFLERLGMLPERYELLDGEIISKMGQSLNHGMPVTRAMFWLAGVFHQDNVLTQVTIEVIAEDQPTNRPEPDVLVLRRPAPEYDNRPPTGADLLLVVEVANTTLRDDLRTKAHLYARAGVAEYWVLDVAARRLFVHRGPGDDGYASVAAYAEDDTVATETRPEATITVAALLPPAPPAEAPIPAA